MDIHDLTNKEKQRFRHALRKRYSDEELKAYSNDIYNQQPNVNSLNSTNIEPANDCLNGISQGDESDQRIGRKYWLRRLEICGQLRYDPPANVSVQPVVRLLVYVDRRTNGNGTSGSSGGSLAGLLVQPTNTANTVFAYRNLNDSDRFDVLADRRFTLRPTANAGATESADFTAPFDLHFNLEKYCYECIVPDLADVPQNYTIRLGLLSNSDYVRLDYNYRIRFSG